MLIPLEPGAAWLRTATHDGLRHPTAVVIQRSIGHCGVRPNRSMHGSPGRVSYTRFCTHTSGTVIFLPIWLQNARASWLGVVTRSRLLRRTIVSSRSLAHCLHVQSLTTTTHTMTTIIVYQMICRPTSILQLQGSLPDMARHYTIVLRKAGRARSQRVRSCTALRCAYRDDTSCRYQAINFSNV